MRFGVSSEIAPSLARVCCTGRWPPRSSATRTRPWRVAWACRNSRTNSAQPRARAARQICAAGIGIQLRIGPNRCGARPGRGFSTLPLVLAPRAVSARLQAHSLRTVRRHWHPAENRPESRSWPPVAPLVLANGKDSAAVVLRRPATKSGTPAPRCSYRIIRTKPFTPPRPPQGPPRRPSFRGSGLSVE